MIKNMNHVNGRFSLSASNNDGLSMRNFKKLRVIGRGAYGLCSLCQNVNDKLKKKVVIKSVSLECRTEKEKRDILCKFMFKAVNFIF